MFARRIALLIGLFCAVVASQLPEFAQQYRQRLGGALDELNAQVARFDADASQSGITRDDGVARLQKSDDRFVQQRGEQMRDTIARRDRLQRQSEGFAKAGPVSASSCLPGISIQRRARAYQAFEPAFPSPAKASSRAYRLRRRRRAGASDRQAAAPAAAGPRGTCACLNRGRNQPALPLVDAFVRPRPRLARKKAEPRKQSGDEPWRWLQMRAPTARLAGARSTRSPGG